MQCPLTKCTVYPDLNVGTHNILNIMCNSIKTMQFTKKNDKYELNNLIQVISRPRNALQCCFLHW